MAVTATVQTEGEAREDNRWDSDWRDGPYQVRERRAAIIGVSSAARAVPGAAESIGKG